MEYVILPVLKEKIELRMFKADMFDKDTLSFFMNVCGNVGDAEATAELVEEFNRFMCVSVIKARKEMDEQARIARELFDELKEEIERKDQKI